MDRSSGFGPENGSSNLPRPVYFLDFFFFVGLLFLSFFALSFANPEFSFLFLSVLIIPSNNASLICFLLDLDSLLSSKNSCRLVYLSDFY